MKLRLFKQRTVPVPTTLGAATLVGLLLSPILYWFYYGEAFLASTRRLPNARILVVEGWIGPEALRAAKTEFDTQNYEYIVTSGGETTPEGWERGGWSYARGAEKELVRLGVPAEEVISAPADETDTGRTYRSALAVMQTLAERGIEPKSINVFTWGTHAQRSRLVFTKAAGSKIPVGVIGWQPTDYEKGPWWRSSERARGLIAESTGFFYELFLNSGR